MVQIYIDNKLIDLDNTNISLQKEFEDAVENIPTEVEYSYTVSIPATLNNKEIFGFVDAFDVADKFKRLYNADLYVDELLILSGKFKVTSIESGYYKGNIYNPKKKTISEILGDRNLNEIAPHWKPMNNLADFDKINNYVCGLPVPPLKVNEKPRYPDEWDCASAETLGYTCEQINDVHDNHVVYPYVLYGLPMNNPDEVSTDMDVYTQDLEYKKHCITDNNIYPAFNVISVLKDIFKTEGYNLTGNIIDGNNKDFYNGLYQTFQYSYEDYKNNKEVPFYCRMKGGYWNYCYDAPKEVYNPSPSLEIMTLFDAPEFTWNFTDDESKGNGSFQYGVDNPWTAGYKDQTHQFSYIDSLDDEKHMFVEGSADENTGIIIIPRSGWYKIRLNGSMSYPYTGDQILSGVKVVWKGNYFNPDTWRFEPTGDMIIGGTTDQADNTTLAEQPFEIHLKRGYPKDNPRFYSFNSFTPMNAVEYYEDKTVALEGDGRTYLRIPEGEKQRRYAKNGSAAYVKQIGDYSGNEFICGARLGGAWFSSQWGCGYHGQARRPNRVFGQGVGLALPDPTKPIRTKVYDDMNLERPYKDEETPKLSGTFYQLADKNTNNQYEYAEKTAQCLVRNDSYTNFLGYNTLVENNGNYIWDTSSNYGAVSWEGADACSAHTGNRSGGDPEHRGEWDVNTVVWLDEGDTLYLEVLIPVHHGGKYQEPDCNDSSEWYDQINWVNAINVFYDLYLGYLNGNKDWMPRPDDGIDTFDNLKKHRLTNVNQFLPQMKCNDYLEKFLKTFNLQLTMKDSKTFSIDTIGGGSMMGNVIDIDKICNIDDAEFKPLKSDSIMEYKWKIDQGETGYAQGNQSPHRTQHSDSISTAAWYFSGYTGEETIVNDANSSGTVKKTEAPWSYNWYKTIHFLNNYENPPITEEYSDISVITDTDIWKNGMTFSAAAKETPKTNKTMRLFTLKKNKNMDNKQYSYINFKYDEENLSVWGGSGAWTPATYVSDKVCNLVLPSNYYETIDINKNKHRLHLDYKIMNNAFDGEVYNQSLMDVFFTRNVKGGYDIEVPIKLSNEDYQKTKQGTLYKLHDGLYRVKSIEGHDINKKDDSTLTLTTLK